MGMPVRGESLTFYTYLVSRANPNVYQVNPTLVEGDVKVSQDGGGFENIAALPVVTPAGTSQVKVVLSAAETDCDTITVLFSDAAGGEWQDRSHQFATDWQSAVWGYDLRTLTQPAGQVAAVVVGSAIVVYSHTTWDITLTGLGDLSSRTKLYFTAKDAPTIESDAEALVSIEETDGLLYIGGTVPDEGDEVLGAITVLDEVEGNINITLDASMSAFAATSAFYGVKMITASSVVLVSEGTFEIETPVPRAIA